MVPPVKTLRSDVGAAADTAGVPIAGAWVVESGCRCWPTAGNTNNRLRTNTLTNCFMVCTFLCVRNGMPASAHPKRGCPESDYPFHNEPYASGRSQFADSRRSTGSDGETAF